VERSAFRSALDYWTNIGVEQRTDMKSMGNEGLLEIKWVEIQKCLSRKKARYGTVSRRNKKCDITKMKEVTKERY
jgi:hypothetical protein